MFLCVFWFFSPVFVPSRLCVFCSRSYALPSSICLRPPLVFRSKFSVFFRPLSLDLLFWRLRPSFFAPLWFVAFLCIRPENAMRSWLGNGRHCGARDSSKETCAMTETVLVPLLLKRFLKKKAMNGFMKRLRLCPGNG